MCFGIDFVQLFRKRVLHVANKITKFYDEDDDDDNYYSNLYYKTVHLNLLYVHLKNVKVP